MQTFYKALQNDIQISIPANYFPMTRETVQYHPDHFILPTVCSLPESYFSRTVQEWNLFPQSIIDLDYNLFAINIF